jgi:beta-galactosidase
MKRTRYNVLLLFNAAVIINATAATAVKSKSNDQYTALLPENETPATSLPFTPNKTNAIHPDGTLLSCDSRGWLLQQPSNNHQPTKKRWFPVGGEIQYGRVPESQWRESLLRMQAGGLDVASVYAFWIHHEEEKGKFNWHGRRNISAFLDVANEVGMKILLRMGPWDHGECRNGGHPDWVLTSCGKLRSTDPKYLTCVQGWPIVI